MAGGRWQEAAEGTQEEPIGRLPARTTDLALKDSELVTESQNLGLKPGFGPPTDQECVEEEANGSVEEGEGHGEDA